MKRKEEKIYSQKIVQAELREKVWGQNKAKTN